MKVLQVNKYLYRRDGVTSVLEATIRLLSRRGYRVMVFGQDDPRNFTKHLPGAYVPPVFLNRPFDSQTGKVKAVLRILFGTGAVSKLKRFIEQEKPDLAHIHNVYHHLSAPLIGVLKRRGIPVVMTLHDYKIFCPSYNFWRNSGSGSTLCTRCSGVVPFSALRFRCVKGSTSASLVCFVESLLHRRYYKQIDRFIAPGTFMARKALEGGIPHSKITVLRNPAFYEGEEAGRFPSESVDSSSSSPPLKKPVFLFLGRLYPEKGAEVLVRAFAHLPAEAASLVIAGEGPEKPALQRLARRCELPVRFPGFLKEKEKRSALESSISLVMPSLWYENCPMSVLEAMAMGKPVIASGIGGIPEIVSHMQNGILAPPGSTAGLAEALKTLICNPDLKAKLEKNAKETAFRKFHPNLYAEGLEEVYRKVSAAT